MKLGIAGRPGDWQVWICLNDEAWNDGHPELTTESFVIGEGDTAPAARAAAIETLRQGIRELESGDVSQNG